MGLFKLYKLSATKYLDKYYCQINKSYELDFYTDSKHLAKYQKDIEEGKSKYVTFLNKEDNLREQGLTVLRSEINSFTWKQEYNRFYEAYRTPEQKLAKEKELLANGWIIDE